jgi:hypothetical protein
MGQMTKACDDCAFLLADLRDAIKQASAVESIVLTDIIKRAAQLDADIRQLNDYMAMEDRHG